MKLEDGQIYYINFSGNLGREINNIHLGVIFTLPIIKDMVFCVPLTSPKIKHFKTIEDFNQRNYKNVKHFNWQYLKQTDSIAMLDQIKIISSDRLLKPYHIKINSKLNDTTLSLLKAKVMKYIELILFKKRSKILA